MRFGQAAAKLAGVQTELHMMQKAHIGQLGGLLPAQGTPSSPVVQHFMSVLNTLLVGLDEARSR